MLKEIASKYSAEQASVYVVWLPMVPGDDQAAAKTTGKMFRRLAVYQYYDPDRLVGSAYRNDHFTGCVRDALDALPADHPMRADLVAWAQSPAGSAPLWDAALFYPPGVEWWDTTPRPAAWSKQVGFFGPDAGDVTGVFFRNDCKAVPVDSDWHVQVREGMKALEQQ